MIIFWDSLCNMKPWHSLLFSEKECTFTPSSMVQFMIGYLSTKKYGVVPTFAVSRFNQFICGLKLGVLAHRQRKKMSKNALTLSAVEKNSLACIYMKKKLYQNIHTICSIFFFLMVVLSTLLSKYMLKNIIFIQSAIVDRALTDLWSFFISTFFFSPTSSLLCENSKIDVDKKKIYALQIKLWKLFKLLIISVSSRKWITEIASEHVFIFKCKLEDSSDWVVPLTRNKSNDLKQDENPNKGK